MREKHFSIYGDRITLFARFRWAPLKAEPRQSTASSELTLTQGMIFLQHSIGFRCISRLFATQNCHSLAPMGPDELCRPIHTYTNARALVYVFLGSAETLLLCLVHTAPPSLRFTPNHTNTHSKSASILAEFSAASENRQTCCNANGTPCIPRIPDVRLFWL